MRDIQAFNEAFLAKISVWVIGDGAGVAIWDDPWLSLETPTRPMGPATRETAHLAVKDLRYPDSGEWNRDVIQAILPLEE